jgi:hypothetical protein
VGSFGLVFYLFCEFSPRLTWDYPPQTLPVLQVGAELVPSEYEPAPPAGLEAKADIFLFTECTAKLPALGVEM